MSVPDEGEDRADDGGTDMMSLGTDTVSVGNRHDVVHKESIKESSKVITPNAPSGASGTKTDGLRPDDLASGESIGLAKVRSTSAGRPELNSKVKTIPFSRRDRNRPGREL
jgi:hypothetical protein